MTLADIFKLKDELQHLDDVLHTLGRIDTVDKELAEFIRVAESHLRIARGRAAGKLSRAIKEYPR